jgi:acetylornithine deacetylase
MRPELLPTSDLIVDAVSTLVRVPSVNPSIAPDGQGESGVAAAAQRWLDSHGVRAWLEEAAPGRPNLVAEVGRDGPTLVLCAHLDTVGVEGMTIDPFEPRLENGRLFGRGSYDMKGSAGAIMAAAVALQRSGLPGRVQLALVADEEHASLGAVDFVRRHRADACIVTEPSEGDLVLAHKGFMWAEIVARGTAAHGSRWDLGVSAIGRMGRIIAALEEHDRRELRSRRHPLVGPASMHCAMVAGGIGLSTYAPECRLKVERRTIPGETMEGAMAELREVVGRVGEGADVELIFGRPSLVCDPAEAIVECVREAVAAETGRRPRETGVAYWMDAAIFAEAGIPTVNYGPGGEGAHAAVEWVDVDSLVRTSRVVAAAATRFFERG